jgi:hypothetical protein
MPTSANCPKNPSDVRADVGIRAPILPLSQQPLASPLERRLGETRRTRPIYRRFPSGAGRPRFVVPTHSEKRKGAFQEPPGESTGPTGCRPGAVTRRLERFNVPMHSQKRKEALQGRKWFIGTVSLIKNLFRLDRACPKTLIPNFAGNLCRNTLSKIR